MGRAGLGFFVEIEVKFPELSLCRYKAYNLNPRALRFPPTREPSRSLELSISAMAVLSDLEEEQVQEQKQTKPSSSSSSSSPSKFPAVDATDEEVLCSILAKKGTMPFLETVIDVLRRKSDLFKDESGVKKIMAVVSAARDKVVADERRQKEAEAARKASVQAEKPKETSLKLKEEMTSEKQPAEAAEEKEKSSGGSEFLCLFISLSSTLI